jgi:hypothetical protein
MQRKPTRKWWAGYNALYGQPGQTPLGSRKPTKVKRSDQTLELPIPYPPEKATKAKSDTPTETYEQVKIATWLSKKNILFYHVPNGGYRNPIEGAKFKRMGVKAGVPDICLPIARQGYHGCYVEVKRQKGGVLSDNQQHWLSELAKEGYYVFVANGADEFIEKIENYLGAIP